MLFVEFMVSGEINPLPLPDQGVKSGWYVLSEDLRVSKMGNGTK
jgi:hypothetical protein